MSARCIKLTRLAAFLGVPAFLGPAFSASDIWSCIFRSCILWFSIFWFSIFSAPVRRYLLMVHFSFAVDISLIKSYRAKDCWQSYDASIAQVSNGLACPANAACRIYCDICVKSFVRWQKRFDVDLNVLSYPASLSLVLQGELFDVQNIMILKSRLGVTQGHWKCTT